MHSTVHNISAVWNTGSRATATEGRRAYSRVDKLMVEIVMTYMRYSGHARHPCHGLSLVHPKDGLIGHDTEGALR